MLINLGSMNRFCFLITGIIVLSFLACTESIKDSDKKKSKPNIVFIFADDLSYNAVGAMENDVVKTPNLDRLASSGTSFSHTYNMGGWNGAVCVASRAMIMSGRFIWRAEEFVSGWKAGNESANQKSWARLMEDGGYNTYMTGKWHIDAPADSLFQTAEHIRPGMPADAWIRMSYGKVYEEQVLTGKKTCEEIMPVGYERPKDENDETWLPTDSTQLGFWKGGKHWSEVVRDDALSFINDAKSKDDPFFMYLAFNAPHDPRQAPQEYIDMYDVNTIPVPDNYQDLYPYKDEIGCDRLLRDEMLAPFPRTEYAVRKHRQEYYAIISHLDDQIGKILDALEATGEMDNTYIFFTADHGLSVGSHGLLGKQNMYDHSVRVPFFVKGPDIPANKTISSPIYLQDVMPTAIDLAGIEKPAYVEFNSLLPQIKSENATSNYEAIYGCYTDTQRMITKGDYKLIAYPKANKLRLYNLKDDPDEVNDLIDNDSEEERIKSLFENLQALQSSMGDTLLLDFETFGD